MFFVVQSNFVIKAPFNSIAFLTLMRHKTCEQTGEVEPNHSVKFPATGPRDFTLSLQFDGESSHSPDERDAICAVPSTRPCTSLCYTTNRRRPTMPQTVLIPKVWTQQLLGEEEAGVWFSWSSPE